MIDTLFDYGEAQASRNAGIDQSAENCGEDWQAEAIEFVRQYLVTHPTLFGDDLWSAGLEKPKSPRGLGAVIRHAQKEGWMELQTHGEYILCKRSIGSRLGLKPVWKSNLYPVFTP